MPIKFKPNYTITPKIMKCLMRIESAKEKVFHLPLTATVLSSLRETARLYTTHYSTMIEGNRLDPNQIEVVLKHEGHFPGRERDEHEVKGYYTALTQVEKWAAQGTPITEKMIQTLHALVMANGKINTKPTKYRDGQNVIRDGRTRAIVYMPPEAKDVKGLMSGMITWMNKNIDLPCVTISGARLMPRMIAHMVASGGTSPSTYAIGAQYAGTTSRPVHSTIAPHTHELRVISLR